MKDGLQPVDEVAEDMGLAQGASDALTRRQKRLVEAGALVFTERPSSEEMAYQHAVLCQVGLPRRKIERLEFERRCGDAWLRIRAGALDEGSGPVEQPIPYGPVPRLALAYISTFAVRHRTQVIPIGHTAVDFLGKLELGRDGRRYRAMRRQMHALAGSWFQLGFHGKTFSGSPIEEFEAWARDRPESQNSLWPGTLVLGTRFYKTLVKSAVPLDWRAVRSLRGSALAMDVYAMLAHRLWRIEGQTTLHWRNLREQFGHEYTGKHGALSFKKEFLKALRAALVVYPVAKVREVKGGVVLYSSPPPIQQQRG